jgi:RNA polymerase sigma factor (sigma-70 family)
MTMTLSPSEQHCFIEANVYRVARIARRFKRRLPSFVEFDELVSWGNVRLVECARRCDPAKRASFGSFATSNIHGAMIDFLRSTDLATRSERQSLGESMPIRWRQPIEASFSVGKPDQSFQAATARRDVRKLMAALPEQHAYVIEQYFLVERTHLDIARELGLTEGRVCQIVHASLAMMRDASREHKLNTHTPRISRRPL